MTKKLDLPLVSLAMLPTLGVSTAVIMLGTASGFSESVAERVSQILVFPVFLGACHAWRQRDRRPGSRTEGLARNRA